MSSSMVPLKNVCTVRVRGLSRGPWSLRERLAHVETSLYDESTGSLHCGIRVERLRNNVARMCESLRPTIVRNGA